MCNRRSSFAWYIRGAVICASLLGGGLLSLGCRHQAEAEAVPPDPIDPKSEVVRYVAIGDSYTSGEGATPEESWPVVLTQILRRFGVNVRLVANPAVTGYTTRNALDQEMAAYDAAAPTFATLMIGVNDYVQRVPKETFRANLSKLLDHMQARLPQHDHILIVTIPDYSVTKRGGDFGPRAAAAAGVLEFNRVLKEEAARRHLPLMDLYPLSHHMGRDPAALAPDGLHPSASEYTLWARAIYPAAIRILRPPPPMLRGLFPGPPPIEDGRHRFTGPPSGED